jgi:excisionase family DNA binding protein
MSKKFLRVADILEVLPVSDETVRNWIRQGKLKARKIGRDYFIDPDDFQAFLNKGSNEPDDEKNDS